MPGTTTGGLPYPFPTDLVTDGASDIQALAEAVDDKYTSAVAVATRAADDAVAGPTVALVASVTYPSSANLAGRVVLVLGSLRWRLTEGPANIFMQVRINGTPVGSTAIGSAGPVVTDTVTTIVGVGVSPTDAPYIDLVAWSSGGNLNVLTSSRIVGVGGFGAPITVGTL